MRRALLAVVIAGCGGGDGGPDAHPIGVPGTYTVAGRVQYEDRAPLETGALGEPTLKPARGVQVILIAEDDDAVLAMGTTAEDGAYALTFDGVGGEQLHVTAATTSVAPERPITVMRLDRNIQAFGGVTFAAGIDLTNDITATVESGTAQAFNVFDVLSGVMDHVRATYNPTPFPLAAIWERGSDDGTYYFERTMHLLGDRSDDDGFDDTVILHEAGHYIEDVEGRSDSPGGMHDGSPADPRLAWSEGFATYYALSVWGPPIYMDSNAGGGFAYNIDTQLTKANGGGAIGQNVSEDMVAEILWDLGDAGSPDDDGLAGTHPPVLKIQSLYLKTATLRPVGRSGADLVDALDGFFLGNGLGSCAAIRAIVVTAHTFPYDFAGPGGSCP
ncbi:MAG: hypothetical protein WKG01_02635 [Kofleriaceae bacterium]